MRKINIEFQLEGPHAEMLTALRRTLIVEPPLTESALAKALICSILEEDAREHEESRPN